MFKDLKTIAQEAGDKVLACRSNIHVSIKEDYSPITEADMASHLYLCEALRTLHSVPVLSEEGVPPYEERKNWSEFWMIDPLDGTKEFIHGEDDFCINISLHRNNMPVVGLIYAPALRELYYAEEGNGFQYEGPHRDKSNGQVVARSRFHHSEKTKAFMQQNGFSKEYAIGAALKFGRMALGEVDLYPRFEGSKEWDTAAGFLILKESGGHMIDLKTGQEPAYNKESIRNNFFIASRTPCELKDFNLEGL